MRLSLTFIKSAIITASILSFTHSLTSADVTSSCGEDWVYEFDHNNRQYDIAESICVNGSVNLKEFDEESDSECNPSDIKGIIPKNREINSDFLWKLMNSTHIKRNFRNIYIECAYFLDSIFLSEQDFGVGLFVEKSLLRGDLNFNDSLIVGDVGILNSNVLGEVSFDRAILKGDLVLEKTRFSKTISMYDLEVLSSIEADDITVLGNIFANRLNSRGQLRVEKSKFGELDISDTEIGGNIVLKGIHSSEGILGYRTRAKRAVLIHSGANLKLLNFSDSEINGNLYLHGVTINEGLSAIRAQVDKDITLSGDGVFNGVNLTNTNIKGSLRIGASTFNHMIDVSNSFIGRELMVSSPVHGDPVWGKGGGINLSNAKARSFHGQTSDFRKDEGFVTVHMNGFQYDLLGGTWAGEEDTFLDEPTSDLISFLVSGERRRVRFSPQPYEEMSRVIESSGQAQKAKEIQYAKFIHRDQHYKGGNFFERNISWALSRYLIGYGVYPERSIFFIISIIGAGYIVLIVFREEAAPGLIRPLFISIGNSIPLMGFGENDIIRNFHREWLKNLLYFQKFLGFILATILVATLSGVVK